METENCEIPWAEFYVRNLMRGIPLGKSNGRNPMGGIPLTRLAARRLRMISTPLANWEGGVGEGANVNARRALSINGTLACMECRVLPQKHRSDVGFWAPRANSQAHGNRELRYPTGRIPCAESHVWNPIRKIQLAQSHGQNPIDAFGRAATSNDFHAPC